MCCDDYIGDVMLVAVGCSFLFVSKVKNEYKHANKRSDRFILTSPTPQHLLLVCENPRIFARHLKLGIEKMGETEKCGSEIEDGVSQK